MALQLTAFPPYLSCLGTRSNTKPSRGEFINSPLTAKVKAQRIISTQSQQHRQKYRVNQLKDKSLNEIKKWLKVQQTEAEFYHRHYLADTEYIPFDATQTDKNQHIIQFLAAEVMYQIIRWEEVEQ
jgi:hypothetical protein